MGLTTIEALRAAVAREIPGARADLERLARIPSIAFEGFDPAPINECSEAVAELLRGVGMAEVTIVEAGGKPAVIAKRPGPPGSPTVLLYAHYDVQPVGDRSQWLSDPFVPTERDGRLYGRGCADDKAGIAVHLASLRALGADLPVGVTVFVEGEEEIGSPSLDRLLDRYRDDLTADVIVLADSGNPEIGVPGLTVGLRGLVNAYVEVRTLDHTVHSGMFGGPVPDALTAMCRLLSTLHDDNGDVAVEGLVHTEIGAADYPEQRLRAESGLLDEVHTIGSGTVAEHLWTRPAISVLGIDAPTTVEAPNALVPSARAKVSLRIAPGDDAMRAYAALAAHLERNIPWGAKVEVQLEQAAQPSQIDASGPAYAAVRSAFTTAWNGVAPVDMGLGGTIPFIATFQQLFPKAEILVTGVEDPDSRAHGPNESLDLGEFDRACLGETLLLVELGKLRKQ